MAHFLVEYRDTGMAGVREEKRGDHIAYRKGLGSAMALAGPLLGDGDAPVGSVVIIEADDQQQAQAVAEADPYVGAGAMEIVSVRKYRIAAMKPPQSA